MSKKVHHQFNIFPFAKPKAKVPISAEKLQEAKKKYQQGDIKGSAALIREVGDSLERYYERKFGKR